MYKLPSVLEKEKLKMEKVKEVLKEKAGKTEGTKAEKCGSTFRLLGAEEIECRVAKVTEKGVSLLLYKDARVDQKILDETFTPFGWKRSHQSIEGNLYCTVEVKSRETGEWIAKQDVGTSGFAEKEKSLASDSFKRACFNWGIGRELYTAPFIWIPAERIRLETRQGGNGKPQYVCKDRFTVTSIGYSSGREINSLSVVNQNGVVVYDWKKCRKAKAEPPVVSEGQLASLEAELKRTGVPLEAVKERYRIKELEKMSEEVYGRVMQALSKTKSMNEAA